MDEKRVWAAKLLLGVARNRVQESSGFGGASLARELHQTLPSVEAQLSGTRLVSTVMIRAIVNRWPDLYDLGAKVLLAPESQLDQVIEEVQRCV